MLLLQQSPSGPGYERPAALRLAARLADARPHPHGVHQLRRLPLRAAGCLPPLRSDPQHQAAAQVRLRRPGAVPAADGVRPLYRRQQGRRLRCRPAARVRVHLLPGAQRLRPPQRANPAAEAEPAPGGDEVDAARLRLVLEPLRWAQRQWPPATRLQLDLGQDQLGPSVLALRRAQDALQRWSHHRRAHPS